jgi:hypothetical protein
VVFFKVFSLARLLIGLLERGFADGALPLFMGMFMRFFVGLLLLLGLGFG